MTDHTPEQSSTEGSGEPVKVARANNQAEAEFLQGILSDNGIKSMLRRSAGFDVPDFLAAGPRDILVSPANAQRAKDILNNAQVDSENADASDQPNKSPSESSVASPSPALAAESDRFQSSISDEEQITRYPSWVRGLALGLLILFFACLGIFLIWVI